MRQEIRQARRTYPSLVGLQALATKISQAFKGQSRPVSKHGTSALPSLVS